MHVFVQRRGLKSPDLDSSQTPVMNVTTLDLTRPDKIQKDLQFDFNSKGIQFCEGLIMTCYRLETQHFGLGLNFGLDFELFGLDFGLYLGLPSLRLGFLDFGFDLGFVGLELALASHDLGLCCIELGLQDVFVGLDFQTCWS